MRKHQITPNWCGFIQTHLACDRGNKARVCKLSQLSQDPNVRCNIFCLPQKSLLTPCHLFSKPSVKIQCPCQAPICTNFTQAGIHLNITGSQELVTEVVSKGCKGSCVGQDELLKLSQTRRQEVGDPVLGIHVHVGGRDGGIADSIGDRVETGQDNLAMCACVIKHQESKLSELQKGRHVRTEYLFEFGTIRNLPLSRITPFCLLKSPTGAEFRFSRVLPRWVRNGPKIATKIVCHVLPFFRFKILAKSPNRFSSKSVGSPRLPNLKFPRTL